MDHAQPVGTDEPDRRSVDRRRGDRRGSLRATAGRRRMDRRRAASAGAGLLMAAVTLLPSLRGQQSGPPQDALSGETKPAPPRPGGPEDLGTDAEGMPFDAFIEEASALYGVSSDLVRAVIQTESGFNPRAVSGV
ncbi:MAG TPA: transglycosylase SLT domain-containing protein, partial [Vicinamibacteria bacterium]|nr:transglycosylase SLT domain-containing protein [Vicinamibacteria bacterium]